MSAVYKSSLPALTAVLSSNYICACANQQPDKNQSLAQLGFPTGVLLSRGVSGYPQIGDRALTGGVRHGYSRNLYEEDSQCQKVGQLQTRVTLRSPANGYTINWISVLVRKSQQRNHCLS